MHLGNDIEKEEIDNLLQSLRSPFKEIDTKYKLDKYLSSKGHLILPRPITLDSEFLLLNVVS